jgi:hypothetical protein
VSKLARILESIPANYSRPSWVDVIKPIVTQLDALSEGRVSAYHGAMSAAPTAGDWVRGDWIKNSLPSPSSFFGWICTESGTPGTWKGFGLIEA